LFDGGASSVYPMKTDSVFYRLFQRLPDLVLDLAEIESTDAGC
jgi:hypothetical protein